MQATMSRGGGGGEIEERGDKPGYAAYFEWDNSLSMVVLEFFGIYKLHKNTRIIKIYHSYKEYHHDFWQSF